MKFLAILSYSNWPVFDQKETRRKIAIALINWDVAQISLNRSQKVDVSFFREKVNRKFAELLKKSAFKIIVMMSMYIVSVQG